MSREGCDSFDLALGHSGTLLGCSLLRDAATNGLNEISDLDILARETLTRIWSYIDTLSPIRSCSAPLNLGVAHGWAGFPLRNLDLVRGVVRPASRFADYSTKRTRRSRRTVWSRFALEMDSGTQNYMPGWCNGSAGYVHLWTAACRRFPDDRFFQMAEGAAWNAWETPGSIPNLCCGLAGQGFALLNFYQLSRQPKWLSMAEQITARDRPVQQQTPKQRSYSGAEF